MQAALLYFQCRFLLFGTGKLNKTGKWMESCSKNVVEIDTWFCKCHDIIKHSSLAKSTSQVVNITATHTGNTHVSTHYSTTWHGGTTSAFHWNRVSFEIIIYFQWVKWKTKENKTVWWMSKVYNCCRGIFEQNIENTYKINYFPYLFKCSNN